MGIGITGTRGEGPLSSSPVRRSLLGVRVGALRGKLEQQIIHHDTDYTASLKTENSILNSCLKG